METFAINTFGSATNQYPIYDPREVRANRQRFRRDAIPALARANSFYCPAGRFASRGWILLSRSDYNRLDSDSSGGSYSTSLQLVIDSTITLKNLSIVQSQCVTRGIVSDANALYLVELTDDRGILFNNWFQIPTTDLLGNPGAAYNIRVPAYPQTFYPDSMNAGTTWTWTTMLQDLWNQMNTLDAGNILGPYPGLPTKVAFSGTPEGFWFVGVPAWTAMNDVLEYLGLTVACDLTKTDPFTIVSSGDTDSAFTDLQTKYAGNLEDDLEWIDTGSARVPRTVRVLFRRRNSIYGTEEEVTYRNDAMAQQWVMTPFYAVTITAPDAFIGAVGKHFIWSDFTVRYDDSGNPLDADTAMADTIAAERVTQYFGKIYRQTAGFMTRTYAGALPFVTGSQVDGVAWVQDYSNQSRQGWKTLIVRGPNPPWPELWG